MEPDAAALLFDVFGTVVDWRGSIIAAGTQLTDRVGADVDWGTFADEWRREGYLRPIIEMAGGKREWEPVDRLLGDQLDKLLERHEIKDLGDADRSELLSVWRRLVPWPDAVRGLTRLKARYIVAPLSNGGFALLTEMAKVGGLPWDCVISAEMFRAYKPSPTVYLGAARLLELSPEQVMMVAAHPGDLDAARSVGLRTAYVPRPLEWGPDAPRPAGDDQVDRFDLIAGDFTQLADLLGA